MIDEKHPIASAVLEMGIEMLIDLAKECDNYLTVMRTALGTGEKWKITVEKTETEGECNNYDK